MDLHAQLTKRETQIAELIAWGATKKDVANKLFISERTAENHTRHIFEKAKVTKMNELSAWWFCKNFNISIELSPLLKTLASASLLTIIVVNIILDNGFERAKRSRRKEDTEIVTEFITD